MYCAKTAKTLRALWQDESGSVAVHWTVMSAAIIGMGVAAVAAVQMGATGSDANNPAIAFSFDNVEGLTRTGWGWFAVGTYGGWTATGAIKGIEIVVSGHRGIHTPDGGNWLDMAASPGNLTLARNLTDLVAGREYRLTFNAADSHANNGVDIYIGGQLVESVMPGSAQFQPYEITFTAGYGASANLLEFRGTGPEDGIGVSLHGIQVR